jgi:hypothetical protein
MCLSICGRLECSAPTSIVFARSSRRTLTGLCAYRRFIGLLAALGAVISHSLHLKLVLVGSESSIGKDQDLNAVLGLE